MDHFFTSLKCAILLRNTGGAINDDTTAITAKLEVPRVGEC